MSRLKHMCPSYHYKYNLKANETNVRYFQVIWRRSYVSQKMIGFLWQSLFVYVYVYFYSLYSRINFGIFSRSRLLRFSFEHIRLMKISPLEIGGPHLEVVLLPSFFDSFVYFLYCIGFMSKKKKKIHKTQNSITKIAS